MSSLSGWWDTLTKSVASLFLRNWGHEFSNYFIDLPDCLSLHGVFDHLKLRNVKLNTRAVTQDLATANLAIELKYGHIESIDIQMYLAHAELHVIIQGVVLIFGPNLSWYQYRDYMQNNLTSLRTHLQTYKQCSHSTTSSKDANQIHSDSFQTEKPSVIGSFLFWFLRYAPNIRFRLDDVTIRFEDEILNPGSPLACGLSLKRMTLQPKADFFQIVTSESHFKAFQSESCELEHEASTHLSYLAHFMNLEIYADDNTSPFIADSALQASRADSCAGIYSLYSVDIMNKQIANNKNQQNWFVETVSFESHIAFHTDVNCLEHPYIDPEKMSFRLQLVLPNPLSININEKLIRTAIRLKQFYVQQKLWLSSQGLRPKKHICQASNFLEKKLLCRQWWQFSMQWVRFIREKNEKKNMQRVITNRIQHQKRYMKVIKTWNAQNKQGLVSYYMSSFRKLEAFACSSSTIAFILECIRKYSWRCVAQWHLLALQEYELQEYIWKQCKILLENHSRIRCHQSDNSTRRSLSSRLPRHTESLPNLHEQLMVQKNGAVNNISNFLLECINNTPDGLIKEFGAMQVLRNQPETWSQYFDYPVSKHCRNNTHAAIKSPLQIDLEMINRKSYFWVRTRQRLLCWADFYESYSNCFHLTKEEKSYISQLTAFKNSALNRNCCFESRNKNAGEKKYNCMSTSDLFTTLWDFFNLKKLNEIFFNNSTTVNSFATAGSLTSILNSIKIPTFLENKTFEIICDFISIKIMRSLHSDEIISQSFALQLTKALALLSFHQAFLSKFCLNQAELIVYDDKTIEKMSRRRGVTADASNDQERVDFAKSGEMNETYLSLPILCLWHNGVSSLKKASSPQLESTTSLYSSLTLVDNVKDIGCNFFDSDSTNEVQETDSTTLIQNVPPLCDIKPRATCIGNTFTHETLSNRITHLLHSPEYKYSSPKKKEVDSERLINTHSYNYLSIHCPISVRSSTSQHGKMPCLDVPRFFYFDGNFKKFSINLIPALWNRIITTSTYLMKLYHITKENCSVSACILFKNLTANVSDSILKPPNGTQSEGSVGMLDSSNEYIEVNEKMVFNGTARQTSVDSEKTERSTRNEVFRHNTLCSSRSTAVENHSTSTHQSFSEDGTTFMKRTLTQRDLLNQDSTLLDEMRDERRIDAFNKNVELPIVSAAVREAYTKFEITFECTLPEITLFMSHKCFDMKTFTQYDMCECNSAVTWPNSVDHMIFQSQRIMLKVIPKSVEQLNVPSAYDNATGSLCVEAQKSKNNLQAFNSKAYEFIPTGDIQLYFIGFGFKFSSSSTNQAILLYSKLLNLFQRQQDELQLMLRLLKSKNRELLPDIFSNNCKVLNSEPISLSNRSPTLCNAESSVTTSTNSESTKVIAEEINYATHNLEIPKSFDITTRVLNDVTEIKAPESNTSYMPFRNGNSNYFQVRTTHSSFDCKKVSSFKPRVKRVTKNFQSDKNCAEKMICFNSAATKYAHKNLVQPPMMVLNQRNSISAQIRPGSFISSGAYSHMYPVNNHISTSAPNKIFRAPMRTQSHQLSRVKHQIRPNN